MIAAFFRHRRTRRILHRARRHTRAARRVAARHHRTALGYTILIHALDCIITAHEITSWAAVLALLAAGSNVLSHTTEYCAEE